MNKSIIATPITRKMCSAFSSTIKPSKTGTAFGGVLQNATVSTRAFGYIFGATPRFEDGIFIQTSEIVKVGNILSSGHYIETVTGGRYLISSVEYNPTLSHSTSSVEAAMEATEKYLEINKKYFLPLQWS